jgi:hypothetical protein
VNTKRRAPFRNADHILDDPLSAHAHAFPRVTEIVSWDKAQGDALRMAGTPAHRSTSCTQAIEVSFERRKTNGLP